MILTKDVGAVRGFRLARTLFGLAVYFTAAYWVDGLLIDSGCAFTVRELLADLENTPVEQIVNTHSHEDHIGANAALQERTGAAIRAHPLALPILADPRQTRLRPYQRVMWGLPRGLPSPHREIRGGDFPVSFSGYPHPGPQPGSYLPV